MKAVKCPVCYGHGRIVDPRPRWETAKPEEIPCNGCGGWGWVEVRDDHDETGPISEEK
jgi:RecJ-like exonuclease